MSKGQLKMVLFRMVLQLECMAMVLPSAWKQAAVVVSLRVLSLC